MAKTTPKRSLILLCCLSAFTVLAYADANGPDPGLSGVPGEVGTCTVCHGSGSSSINTNGGRVSLSTGTSSTYTPGEIQHWILTIADPSAKRWGFQAAARQASSTATAAGGFVATDTFAQVICSSSSFRSTQRTTTGACASTTPLMYVEHTLTGTRNGTTGSVTFSFDWHAPATNVGPVSVFVAANAANGNNNDDSGDHIYSASYTLTPSATVSTAPAITEVVNGASFTSGIEAGSWVTIRGTNLTSATTCDAVSSPGPGCRTWSAADFTKGTPTSLDGVSVSIGGQPAYVYYISPTQINVQAPDLGASSATVTVTNAAGTSNGSSAVVADFAPALFLNGTYAIATHLDGSLVASASLIPGAKPAVKGETVILWGTGFGAVSPAVPSGQTSVQALGSTTLAYAMTAPTILIGGAQATVISSVLSPSALGLYQIAITIPAAASSGDQQILATLGGKSSPANVMISVQ